MLASIAALKRQRIGLTEDLGSALRLIFERTTACTPVMALAPWRALNAPSKAAARLLEQATKAPRVSATKWS